jgi:hypothetical protein
MYKFIQNCQHQQFKFHCHNTKLNNCYACHRMAQIMSYHLDPTYHNTIKLAIKTFQWKNSSWFAWLSLLTCLLNSSCSPMAWYMCVSIYIYREREREREREMWFDTLLECIPIMSLHPWVSAIHILPSHFVRKFALGFKV